MQVNSEVTFSHFFVSLLVQITVAVSPKSKHSNMLLNIYEVSTSSNVRHFASFPPLFCVATLIQLFHFSGLMIRIACFNQIHAIILHNEDMKIFIDASCNSLPSDLPAASGTTFTSELCYC